jgi:hypothetical protein
VFGLALGAPKSPIQQVLRADYMGVKELGQKADHYPPCSAEIKNGGAIPPLSSMSSGHTA